MGDKTNGGNIPLNIGRGVAINVPFSLNVMLTSPISSSCCLSKRSNFHCPSVLGTCRTPDFDWVSSDT